MVRTKLDDLREQTNRLSRQLEAVVAQSDRIERGGSARPRRLLELLLSAIVSAFAQVAQSQVVARFIVTRLQHQGATKRLDGIVVAALLE